MRIWFIRLAISRSFSIGIGIFRSFSASPATRQRKLPFNSLGIFIFLSYLYTCVYSFYSLINLKKKKKEESDMSLSTTLLIESIAATVRNRSMKRLDSWTQKTITKYLSRSTETETDILPNFFLPMLLLNFERISYEL